MTVEYKNEVTDIEFEDPKVLDAVSRDPQFGHGVISKLNEQDESHEWEEADKRLCTIEKIYKYSIVGSGNESKIGHGFTLKPKKLRNREAKDFKIGYSIDEGDISQFKEGQKVWYIKYKQKNGSNLKYVIKPKKFRQKKEK